MLRHVKYRKSTVNIRFRSNVLLKQFYLLASKSFAPANLSFASNVNMTSRTCSSSSLIIYNIKQHLVKNMSISKETLKYVKCDVNKMIIILV